MTITKITYSKTLESCVMGAGVWTRIGVEGVVAEGENISNAIEEARATVEDAHQKHLAVNPQPTGDIYFNVSKQK